MSLEVQATYVNGVLKLDQPLPFQENERLTIQISPKTSRVQESYGRIKWTGDPEILRRIAEDDEVMEQERISMPFLQGVPFSWTQIFWCTLLDLIPLSAHPQRFF